jgi:hypothetical protein
MSETAQPSVADLVPDYDDVQVRLAAKVCRHEILPWMCQPCLLEAYQAMRAVVIAADNVLDGLSVTGATPADDALAAAMDTCQAQLIESRP